VAPLEVNSAVAAGALAGTATTLAVCFVVLPNVPALSSSLWWSRLVVTATITLALACLGMYYRLITALVAPREAERV